MKPVSIFFLFFLLQITAIFAKESTARFVMNKGQWQKDILFKQDFGGGHILFGKDKVSYLLLNMPQEVEGDAHKHSPSTQQIKGNLHTMTFAHANAEAKLIGEEGYADYINFYLGNDPTKWAEKVPVFSKVKYSQIYKGIDVVFEVIDDQLKYTFYVAPYADVSQIQLFYEGMENMGIDDEGNLVLSSEQSAVKELAPKAFQGGNVLCNYLLHHQVVSFNFPKGYDKSQALVIDPTVIFSTFTGSTQDNWGFTATYDNSGNAYAGGIIWSAFAGSTGYPTTAGAIQTSFMGGDRDATITKFNSAGTALIYSTYMGGSFEESPHSMVVNSTGDLLVYGRTNSANFPSVAGSYDVTFNGSNNGGNANYDIFIAKFSPTGTLSACTFLGGTGNDGMNGTLISLPETYTEDFLNYNYSDDARGEIIVDDLDNVYIASCSASSDFPVTTGCFQPNLAGGRDAVVAKLDANLSSLLFSTYFGGTNIDAGFGIKVDNSYTVYITGSTRSNNLPTSVGAYQTAAPGGNTDGFIAKLNSTGTSLSACTYIGTASADQSYFVELDKNNNVYVTGQSLGTMPIVNAVFSNANSRQFITKFDNSLSTILVSTTFGSTGSTKTNISPTAFLVDNCGNICVAGWGGTIQQFSPGATNPTGAGGGTTFNMPTTAGAYQTTTDGSDFYIIVLQPNASGLLYGTYFGGNQGGAFGTEHVDGGTSRFDPSGIIYEAVCAACGQSNFPTTPGVWSTTNNSTNCNLGLFKIDLELGGISANFNPLDSLGAIINVTTEGCAPLTIDFENLTVGANPVSTTYEWFFGIPGATSTQFEPSFTYTTAGTYQVMLIVTDSTVCNPKDTTYKDVIVYAPPIVDAGPPQSLCPGAVAQLQATGTGSFLWSPLTGLSNPLISNPTASPPNTTQYIVTLTDSNGCKASDNVTVSIQNFMSVNAGADILLCTVAPINLLATSNQPNTTWSWSPSTGLSSTAIANPVCNIAQGQQTYIVTGTTPAGCTGIDTITVGVFEVNFVQTNPIICIGDSVTLQTGITTPASFSWSPPTYLSATNIANPVSTPTQNISYTVIVTDPSGCSDTGQVNLQVVPLPVVNAGNDILECRQSQVQLQGSADQANVTWAWTPNTGLSSTTISNPIANAPGQQLYTLTATNANGCVGSDNITVNIFPINFVPSTPETCYNSPIMLQTGIVGATAYSWTPPLFLDASNIATPTATATQSISYTVYVTGTAGCSDTGQVALQVWQLPTANAGLDVDVCMNNSTQLSASGGVQYVWQPAFGLSDPTSANPTVNVTDTTIYSLTVTDIHNCVDNDTIVVNVIPIPNVIGNGPFVICQGDSVQIQASGGQSYEWYENAYLSSLIIQNPIAFPLQPTTFIVKGFGINNCYDTASVFVNAIPKPKTDVTGDFKICIGEQAIFNASGGDSYLWETGETTPNIILTPQVSQWISCQATLGLCKAYPDSSYINVITDIPIADFGMEPDSGWAPMTVNFTDQSIGEIYKRYWDFGFLPGTTYSTEKDPSFTYLHAGTFKVMLIVYDANGCKDTAFHSVFADNVTLFVPSAFTPNLDGSNEDFIVKYFGIKTLRVDIYSRWGTLIFSSDDRDFRWNGTYNSVACPEDAYVYVIRGIGENGKLYEHKGTVTLVR